MCLFLSVLSGVFRAFASNELLRGLSWSSINYKVDQYCSEPETHGIHASILASPDRMLVSYHLIPWPHLQAVTKYTNAVMHRLSRAMVGCSKRPVHELATIAWKWQVKDVAQRIKAQQKGETIITTS